MTPELFWLVFVWVWPHWERGQWIPGHYELRGIPAPTEQAAMKQAKEMMRRG